MQNKLTKSISAAALAIAGILIAAAPALAFGAGGYFNATFSSSAFSGFVSRARYGFGRASGLGFYRLNFGDFGFGSPGNANGFSITFNNAPGAVSSDNSLTAQGNAVVSSASPAVVYINAYKSVPTYALQYSIQNGRLILSKVPAGSANQEQSSGSGFFITSNGYILTNKHVVADTSATYMVNYQGQNVAAQVVYRDPNYDLAIVKIDGSNYPTLQLGDSSALTVGQQVVAIGNALGQFTDYATQGTVQSLSESIVVSGEDGSTENLPGVIQTDARLYPGDSGGPLLNMNGQVVAVDTATSVGSTTAQGFSIPINIAKQVIASAGIILQ